MAKIVIEIKDNKQDKEKSQVTIKIDKKSIEKLVIQKKIQQVWFTTNYVKR